MAEMVGRKFQKNKCKNERWWPVLRKKENEKRKKRVP